MKFMDFSFQITNYAIFVANERGHYEAVNKNCEIFSMIILLTTQVLIISFPWIL